MLKCKYISAFIWSHLSGWKDLFAKKAIKVTILKTITKTMVTTDENVSTVNVS